MDKGIQKTVLLEVGVKAFLYINPGEYLFLKRSKPYTGQKICKWDIPGGRIIPGEKTHQALKREIKEETGLLLEKIDCILAVQDILRVGNKHTVRVTYLAKCSSGKIKLNPQEHNKHQWIKLNGLKKYRVDKYLKPIIENMAQIEKLSLKNS